MKTPKIVLLTVILATAVFGVLLVRRTRDGNTDNGSRPKTLLLYCAAGAANPVTAVARDYEKESGVRVEIQFGGSGTLLNNIRLSRLGDLFLAADSSYLEIARKNGLMAETVSLARIRPVLAVKKGNPKSIRTVQDLLRADVRAALANPEAASIGKQTQLLLIQTGEWPRMEEAVRTRGVFKPTVNDVANDVKLGAVDAGIVWDATIRQKDYANCLDAIELRGSEAFIQEITVGVLRQSAQPTAALHFARYLGARDKGLPVFARMGFTPVEGDAWADHPKILLFAGAVNRLAIQDTIQAFEQREGVEVTTVFNGCGILNGQLKLGEKPDVYQTCDFTFMKGVEDQFLSYRKTSETDIVIVTAKGNPRAIHQLKDLSRPGLRIGLGHEQQSTLGTLTMGLLKKNGIYEKVWKNVVATTPTADLLVIQMRAGSLDAAIVYRVNTMKVRGDLEVISIDDPTAMAVQSIAIGKSSQSKHLVGRLLDAFRSTESRQRFEQAGFRWIESEPNP